MTEHEMQEAHPLEYRRILSALDFLKNHNNLQSDVKEAEAIVAAEEMRVEDDILRVNDEMVGA
jgi:hypothetical protein